MHKRYAKMFTVVADILKHYLYHLYVCVCESIIRLGIRF